MGVTDDNVSDIFRALPPRSILLLKNIDTAVCKRGAKGHGKDKGGGKDGAVKEEAEAAMRLGVVSCSSESSWCSSATATTATGTSPSTPATRIASAGSPSPSSALSISCSVLERVCAQRARITHSMFWYVRWSVFTDALLQN